MNGLPSVSVMNRRSSGSGGLLHQRLQFGDQPQLRDRERAELHFKADDALGRGLDRAAHGARALIRRDRLPRSAGARRAETCRCRRRDRRRSRPAAANPAARSNRGPRNASSTRFTIADTTSGGV